MKVLENTSLFIIKFARRYFRNTWIHKVPITSWVYRKLFTATFSEPEKEIIFRGNKYLVPTKDTSMVPSIINQDYEAFELDIFRSMLKPGMVVLDVGANLGTYSLEASKATGPKGKVYAFEPIAENLRFLRHNLSANNASNVTVIPVAIGDKTGKSKIYLDENNVGTHSMGGKSSNSVQVQTDTIDNFVKKNHLRKINFIKMDIEGFEAQALNGARKTLSDGGIPMLIEFSANHLKNCGTEPQEFADKLVSLYEYCYLIDERGRILSRVTKGSDIAGSLNVNLLLTNQAKKARV
jgi:FkbM family methyltransferase